jgi:hypothetical protein
LAFLAGRSRAAHRDYKPERRETAPSKRGVLRMNLLDIVTAMNRELRFCATFRALLHDVDKATEQRITRAYIEWVNRMLDAEKEQPNEPH